MKLLDHFHKLRKADLQGYYMRWFPNEEMISDRDKLEERLRDVMSDPRHIRERYDRLSRSGRDFVAALLTRDRFRGTVDEIRGVPRARSIENFEVENLLRNLKDEGWIIPISEARNGTRSEVYMLPHEIGEGLGNTVDVECREAIAMLSLEAFLRQLGRDGAEDLAGLISMEALKSRIRDLPDPELRLAVKEALDEHGGILPLNFWRESSGRRNGDSSSGLTADWRRQLEENLLGTTGVLSLKNYGIDVEEDCLIVFQELVHSYALEQVVNLRVENDREFSVGVDLLIDIRRLLELARTEEVEVTREGSVFKKTEERLVGHLLTSQHKPLFEDSPVEHVIRLCKRLRLLNHDDHHLRADPVRRRIWSKKRIPTMLRTVFELYQNESRGHRWSFHQTILREIFLDHVVGRPGGGVEVPWKDEPLGRWVPSRPLLTAVVARFLCSLEKRGVAETLKETEKEEFRRGHFVVPLDRLAGDLAYWVIHRLALVGFVDLGFQDGKFHSVRMSSLGCRYFKLDVPEAGDGQLVVNPDYEILLFPGGKNEAEHNYMVGSFAERTGTEWVKRYRITRDSVKRGVISGHAADYIVEFLEKKCRTPIPANVKYSILDWAQGVEPIIKQRTLLLKARSVDGADALCQILEDSHITHERIGEKAVALRGTKQEKALMALQDTLRGAGLFLE